MFSIYSAPFCWGWVQSAYHLCCQEWVICGIFLLGLQVHSGGVGCSWQGTGLLCLEFSVTEFSLVTSEVLCFFQDKER
jgi:hypothetical protein